MTATALRVRLGAEGDLDALTAIDNHYIVESAITFEVLPFTPAARRSWLAQFSEHGPHRLLVATVGDEVAGYAASHQYRTKPAYATTVETTVYCAPQHCTRGIGSQLYAALFDALDGEDVRCAIAAITLPNPVSLALHRRFGFTDIGVQHDVGRKFGRYWDVLLLQKRLH